MSDRCPRCDSTYCCGVDYAEELLRLKAERDYLRKCLQMMADTDFGDYHSDWLREMAEETLRGELKEANDEPT